MVKEWLKKGLSPLIHKEKVGGSNMKCDKCEISMTQSRPFR